MSKVKKVLVVGFIIKVLVTLAVIICMAVSHSYAKSGPKVDSDYGYVVDPALKKYKNIFSHDKKFLKDLDAFRFLKSNNKDNIVRGKIISTADSEGKLLVHQDADGYPDVWIGFYGVYVDSKEPLGSIVRKFVNINFLMGDVIYFTPIVEDNTGVVYAVVWIDDLPVNYDILMDGYARYSTKYNKNSIWYVDKETSIFWGKYMAMGYTASCSSDRGVWGYKWYDKYNYFKGNKLLVN